MKLDFCAMKGRLIWLEPMTAELKEALRAVIESDPEAWQTLTVNPLVQGFDAYWSPMMEGIESGQRLAYAIRRLSDGGVVGTSSYMGIRPSQRGVEIGATFVHPNARGGYANVECKLLMLEHAFAGGAVRVEFVVDAENHRSKAAVLKLGASREGLLRGRKIAWNGEVRDVVIFSLVDRDWPAARARLRERLDSFQVPA